MNKSDAPGPAPNTQTCSRYLFVVGPARSGTTVLQDALNSSPQVYILGEPDFHKDPGTPDFARRYNEMHRRWKNQETKSTFCPELFQGDALWQSYIDQLSHIYRLVGAKIVTHPDDEPIQLRRLFEFQCRYFYNAHYVFTFKDPASVIASSKEFQLATGGQASSFIDTIRNYISTVGLFVLMKRTLPNVHIVSHGSLSQSIFAMLELKLGVDLAEAYTYYDETRVVKYQVDWLWQEHRRMLELTTTIFEDLTLGAEMGFGRIYLAQNNKNVTPNHLTLLGGIQRRVDVMLAAISEGTTHLL